MDENIIVFSDEDNNMEEIDLNDVIYGASLAYYIVKELHDKYPDKQISKHFLQRLFYLIDFYVDLGLDYSIYHSGPVSSMVKQYIDMAHTLHFISIKWKEGKGYFIKPLKPRKHLQLIETNIKHIINKIINNFGKYTTNELSIITLAFNLKYRTGIKSFDIIVDSLVDIQVKFEYEDIEKILSQIWSDKSCQPPTPKSGSL